MVVTEQDVKDLFVKEYNALDKEKAIMNAKNIIGKLTDTTEIDSKIKTATDNAKEILNQINDLIERNARKPLNQDKVKVKNKELTEAYQKATDIVKELEKEKQEKCDRRIMLLTFINNLKEQALTIKEFDEGLFCALVDKILVFKDKMEIRWRGSIDFNNKNEK